MSDLWYMDSEFCCRCGCLLQFFETDICFDCLEDERFREQERLEDFIYPGEEEEEQLTIGTPEEAYVVSLSLVDEEEG